MAPLKTRTCCGVVCEFRYARDTRGRRTSGCYGCWNDPPSGYRAPDLHSVLGTSVVRMGQAIGLLAEPDVLHAVDGVFGAADVEGGRQEHFWTVVEGRDPSRVPFEILEVQFGVLVDAEGLE